MQDHKEKHLEFIQAVITRMNSNSFQLKGWAVTMLAALLALFAGSQASNKVYLFVSVGPTALFWILDASYLHREKKYIGLYNDVAGLSDVPVKKDIKAYDMSADTYEKGIYNFLKCMWSKSIWPLYLFMAVGALVLGLSICP